MWLTLARKSHKPELQDSYSSGRQYVVPSICENLFSLHPALWKQGHGDENLFKRFTEFHVENTPMAWKCFPARYTTRNTVRPWQRSWMKPPIFVRELPRITREQRAPRAVNKGVPSQHMREFTLFHLGCVPSWVNLWGIEDFTCPQSPKSVPRSCHKHLCSSFWLIISPPVARWGFSWWGKIILIHTNLRKTGRIMNLFWYYSSEKGGRGTSCPHLRWQPLLCHLKQFWNNCRSPSDPALSGTVANYYSPWNKNTQSLQLSWLSLI